MGRGGNECGFFILSGEWGFIIFNLEIQWRLDKSSINLLNGDQWE